MLMSVRTQFISRVSEPVLRKLLDKLLERGVITDDEMESAATLNRPDKARVVIDMVRRKGSQASSALIAALYEEDSCLSAELLILRTFPVPGHHLKTYTYTLAHTHNLIQDLMWG
uniref:CARD domain-containing protein n=1 Tax=Seriola lalandi dorsalis TaxID=1841481 RepID=A0A3B4X252_SERLL